MTKTNPTGSAVYEYDGQNRLVSYTPPLPDQHGAITYEYNNLRQKTSVANGSRVVQYEYYANGWLKAVTDEYTYDAWGNLTNHTQNEGSVSQPYQYVGQLGYYTHVQDANLPLLQLGVRMYDPEIGRFGQVDPVGDGVNWYAYVHDNPVAGTDPYGLKSMRQMGCPELYEEIMKYYRELQTRRGQLLEDKWDMTNLMCCAEPVGWRPRTRPGEEQQFRNKQQHLRNLLQEFNAKNCGNKGYECPDDVWELATMPVPKALPKKCVPGTIPLPAPGTMSPQPVPIRPPIYVRPGLPAFGFG